MNCSWKNKPLSEAGTRSLLLFFIKGINPEEILKKSSKIKGKRLTPLTMNILRFKINMYILQIFEC
ncbi:hypothetical protein D3H55_19340 [Bacillus salacetis]|uniref:Uncharacterized protein n=1 Tax=Bacillus salacetis TaxID=2315464 RepID=A0A3A1QQA1_9BACI|nr:hypothetical protein D3H55_19340 [Bacillus salacetis]